MRDGFDNQKLSCPEWHPGDISMYKALKIPTYEPFTKCKWGWGAGYQYLYLEKPRPM